MDPISNLQPTSESAAPARKRGVFLPNRFFGGKDKEPLPLPDENPGFATGSPTPGPAVPEPVAAAATLVSKLALTSEPAPVQAPTVPATNHPSPVMTTNDSTRQPDSRRASAQLTLGFEITSLQLTPVFKLGSVQLRALSNVVALHLVTAGQTDPPLAAAVAFQIEHVGLDDDARLKSLLLKPLDTVHELAAPRPGMQIDRVTLGSGGDGAPIAVTTAAQTSTPVQLFGTFRIAALEFTPAFEIGSLRLEPVSHTVLVRVAPSSHPVAQDLPPSFELAGVHVSRDGTQIAGARLIPGAASNA